MTLTDIKPVASFTIVLKLQRVYGSFMNRIFAQIQNGDGRLVFNEDFLADINNIAFIDIPTVHNIPFRIQFRFHHAKGKSQPPAVEISRYDRVSIEIKSSFGDPIGAYVGTTKTLDIDIAGQKYRMIFLITKVHSETVRIEVSLYEA